MEKNKNIIIWDDINFFMIWHRPDTKEKIIEDCIKLIKRHNNLKKTHPFNSIHTIVYHNYLDLMLLMGIMDLCNRIGRLEKNE